MHHAISYALRVGLVALLALAVTACGSLPSVESDRGIEGAPEWVNQGTGLLRDGDSRLFHGVGQAPAMGDRSLQIETADNRARAKLARSLSTYMEVVASDYRARSGEGERAVDEAGVSRQIEAVTELNLAGARIIGRWRNPETDTVYALAELRLQEVADTTAGVEAMDPGLRDHLQERGGHLFDRTAQDDEE
ncbi:MAG: LPP20 family lipoprotein [Pseudomonadota bacterium]